MISMKNQLTFKTHHSSKDLAKEPDDIQALAGLRVIA